jgi:hypothetical protein
VVGGLVGVLGALRMGQGFEQATVLAISGGGHRHDRPA